MRLLKRRGFFGAVCACAVAPALAPVCAPAPEHLLTQADMKLILETVMAQWAGMGIIIDPHTPATICRRGTGHFEVSARLRGHLHGVEIRGTVEL